MGIKVQMKEKGKGRDDNNHLFSKTLKTCSTHTHKGHRHLYTPIHLSSHHTLLYPVHINLMSFELIL